MISSNRSAKPGLNVFLYRVANRCSALGILLVLLFSASGQSVASSTSSSYTREAFLPYLSSAFYAAATGTSMYFGTNFINPNAVVMNGISMPPELLQDMGNGEVVRVKVLIPPGTEYANFTVDTGQAGGVKWGVYSQDLPFCASQPSNNLQTCISAQDLRTDSLITGTLANYQGSSGGTNPTPRYAYIVLQAGAAGFRWANITINLNVNNPSLYTPWRNARSWAGGSGDCDGLGTTNCTSSTTPTTTPPATTFSIAASSQQVTAGGSYTLTASNGTIGSCTSNNPTVIPNPAVAAGGASASGTVASTAAANSQVIISCTSTASTTAATTLTVTVPTFTISPSSQQVVAGATYTLTAQNSTLAFCSSSNTSVAPAPTVNTGGATATGTIVAGAAAGSQATITCASSAATSATATVTVSAPATTASFSLTSVGISKLASTSAAITTTVNGAATGYWVAIPYSTTAPTQPSTTQIKGGLDALNAAVTLKGTGSMAANVATEFALANLTANTSYQVFFYAEDAANASNKTAIMPVALVTNATSITPAAITYAAGGTGNASLTLATTIVPASNHTGTGNYYVAALVPKSFVPPYGMMAFLTATQGAAGQIATEWKVWTGGALLPYSQETLQTKTISILDGKLDVSALIGTVVYAGYGVGGDTSGLGEVLVAEKIHTIK